MPQHLSWVVFIGLPIFAIWVLGVPLLIYVTLRRRQEKLDSENNLRALGFWYIGLKRRSKKDEENVIDSPVEMNSNNLQSKSISHETNAYYWELLMELRKTTLITINTISSAINIFYRALLMLIILYLTCLLVTKIQPYRTKPKNPSNTSNLASPKAQSPPKFIPNLNKIHYLADLTALLTFAIAISLEVVSSTFLKYSFFAAMVVVNIAFLGLFVYNYIRYVMAEFLEKRRKKREERDRLRQIEEFKKQEEYKQKHGLEEKILYETVIRRRKKLDKYENFYKFHNADNELSKNFKQKIDERVYDPRMTEVSKMDSFVNFKSNFEDYSFKDKRFGRYSSEDSSYSSY